MDEEPKPKIKIPSLINPFNAVTSVIDPIHDMGLQLQSFHGEENFPFKKKKQPPMVRIEFEGYFDIGFPPSFPPIVMSQFKSENPEVEKQNWIDFFNTHSILNPLTTNDKIFYEREFGNRLEDRQDFDELFGVDHGYYDLKNPIFSDECDYALTSKCVIELDDITDLDEGLSILRRLCSEHNVNLDDNEEISLSDLKINTYALFSDSHTYSIEVSIYTALEADEDFNKVQYLDEIIDARNRAVDTSFQHRVGNLIKLPFYFIIANTEKSRIHYQHNPTPRVVWPDYIEESKFGVVYFQNQFSSDENVIISRSEDEYRCNPAWNRRYLMLEENLPSAIDEHHKALAKIRESFSKNQAPGKVLNQGKDALIAPEMNEYFDWPSTEASPSWYGIDQLDTSDWPRIGVLKTLGYDVSEKSPLVKKEDRWPILDYVFTNSKLPFVMSYDHMIQWGSASSSQRLKKLANSLAAFGRNMNRQGNTRSQTKYNEDLDYLKTRYYELMFRNEWNWPSTEVD